MSACHVWTCKAPGCSGITYQPAGEPVDCPRCGEPIERDLVARVAEQRAETERVKARRAKR